MQLVLASPKAISPGSQQLRSPLMGIAGTVLGAVRTLVKSVSPALYGAVSYRRNEGREHRIAATLIRRYGDRVQSGPFKGMHLTTRSVSAGWSPKLLGCYEEEVQPLLERVLYREYHQIVNIGAAEGYYAVGLALRIPDAEVWAFDSQPRAQETCSELAYLNGVANRLRVHGHCTAEALRAILAERALVVCDCEGAELDLLDPGLVPALVDCDMLVETHEFLRPGVSAVVGSRFARTHSIAWVQSCPRDPSRYGALRLLRAKDRVLAVDEHRPAAQSWALLLSMAWIEPEPTRQVGRAGLGDSR